MTVRRFAASEWRLYRDLRLGALADAPEAFGSTLAEAEQHPDEHWAARLRDAAPQRDLPLLAEVDGKPGGIAWAHINPAKPGVANVFQMWVVPGCRGLGLGRMLLDAALDWARRRRVRAVALSVTSGNVPATRLYTSAGFRPVGAPEPMRPGSVLLAQPMVLELASGLDQS